MRKIIAFMHVTLDGFVAGPNGEMDCFHVDEEIFDYVAASIETIDLALYGRNTWQMMESYWPTAADQPGASKHDKEHAAWYKKVDKIVLSNSLAGQQIPKVTIVNKDLRQQINSIKEKPGKEIVIFGSPGAVHSLMKEDLVDEFWLFVNPVLLGSGIPLFKDIDTRKKLTLLQDKRFSSGVIVLRYSL
jgi:dihydrofolate reductase